MILSASRRTDIPAYYAEWFMNRIREGFVYINTPRREERYDRLPLTPETTDCIVFWTKNAKPMERFLQELTDRGYRYYFTYTVTPYGREMESGLPDKEEILSDFAVLSEKLGPERVVWRYDPIVFGAEMDASYHEEAFGRMAGRLRGYTDQCTVSFLDIYPGTRRQMIGIDYEEPAPEKMFQLASRIAPIARENGMRIVSCAEKEDFRPCGIEKGACIDPQRVARVAGCRITAKKDAGQRPECGCCESVDIGMYDTCMSGCAYCYATSSKNNVLYRMKRHDKKSPMLVDKPEKGMQTGERKVRSLKDPQLSLFDFWEY